MPQPTWRERAPEIQKMLDEGKSYGEIADFYGAKRHVLRSKLKQLRDKGLISYENRETHHDQYVAQQASGETPRIPPDAKREIDRHGHERKIDWESGGHYSKKLVWMSDTQDKDEAFLLTAHGYDPKVFKVTSSTSKIWNGYSKLHGIFTLFSSTITVRKRSVQDWTFDDLVKAIRADAKPVEILRDVEVLRSERMLQVSLMDQHWGNARYDDYKETQRLIYDLLNSKRWDETLFTFGSDMFHADNFKSTTVSGTQLETVDMPRAWNECSMFYNVLIETAIRQSNTVKIVYIPGNHDQSMGWSFVQYLKVKFPQTEVDDRVRERKVVVYHKNFVGLAHGDKSRRDLIRIFPSEFPLEWAQTTNRAAYIGHLHREEEVRAKDEFGLTIRTLSTRNPIDAYHDANGYVTAHRRFMLFEYDQETLRHIHYV